MILIFGAGISGLGVAKFLLGNGTKFWITDDNPLALYPHREIFSDRILDNWDDFDFCKIKTLIISPGVKMHGNNPHKIAQKAKLHGVRIVTDLQYLKEINPNAFYIGVTGSNGKSTTASLISHVLNGCGFKNSLVGNIGVSPFNDPFAKCFVVEISSYQLENTHFDFDIGIILNLSENHLERYDGSMHAYKWAKARILHNCKFGLIGTDSESDEVAREFEGVKRFSTDEVLKNGYSMQDDFFYKNTDKLAQLPKFTNLIGEHNLQNILAALSVCDYLQIPLDASIKAVLEFKTLPHRLEFVAQKDGVQFINDSKSTTHIATQVALQAVKSDIFLICGGQQKTVGIEGIVHTVPFKRVKKVFLYGECAKNFANHLTQTPHAIYDTLSEATESAYIEAKNRNLTILLSPLCASFDQFKNFEERGSFFKKMVKKFLTI
jgi:UDP-N-acetylmuramoylalanine--D-glutamate ligase